MAQARSVLHLTTPLMVSQCFRLTAKSLSSARTATRLSKVIQMSLSLIGLSENPGSSPLTTNSLFFCQEHPANNFYLPFLITLTHTLDRFWLVDYLALRITAEDLISLAYSAVCSLDQWVSNTSRVFELKEVTSQLCGLPESFRSYFCGNTANY